MQIFISEFVCGGGWPEPVLPQSLAAEGGAMLRALCEDCARLPDAEVVTTLDVRSPLTLPSAVEVLDVAHPDEEWERFLELAVESDVTIVIAPELDDMLTQRVRGAREAGANVLAPPTEIIELCSDKLRLAQFLTEHDIPTIPTLALTDAAQALPWNGRLVVKPRFGAGSQGIVTLDAPRVNAYLSPESTPPTSQRIVQPLINGWAYSVGALCHPSAGESDFRGDILHVAHQSLSPDGRFQYLAGSMPSGTSRSADDKMFLTVDACRKLLSDLAGYVGFDFVVPEASPDEPLLVEINPRLCTSYLGYRALTNENLAHRLLSSGPHPRLIWERRNVTFFPNGDVRLIPRQEAPSCG